jgi:hypothetical protein
MANSSEKLLIKKYTEGLNSELFKKFEGLNSEMANSSEKLLIKDTLKA